MAFPIKRRNVTLRYYGSKISGSQQWGEKQKNNRFRLVKNTFAGGLRFFVYFLAVFARLRHEAS